MFPLDLDSEQEDNSRTLTGLTESMSSAYAGIGVQSELSDVGSMLVSDCCQQQCLLSLTPNMVVSTRKKLNTLTSSERRQWITDKVFESSKASACLGNLEMQVFVSGVTVCKSVWCTIHQVSHKQLSRASRKRFFI